MNYYSDKEIEKIQPTSLEMLKLVEDVLKCKHQCILPPKTSIKLPDAKFINTMPCVMPPLNLYGIKCISRYPNNTPSLSGEIYVYDFETANLKAILDAKKITTLRTAAVAVHSIKLLAKNDYKTVAFIGLGEVGKATLKILIDTADRPLKIKLFNYKNQALPIVDCYKNFNNLTFEVCENYIDMIKDSDVVVSAVTYAESDFAPENVYKKGVLLVPIHTRGFMQCDLTFDKIFGDDTGHIEEFKYFKEFKCFNEVSDVLLNNCAGRENDDERIIAYNIGIALHDIAFANYFINLINNKK